jgi:hypothetical protein
MITTVQAIHRHQLNVQPDGTVTASVLVPDGLLCYNPDRPAVVGDVYSITPEGAIVARPSGTAQAWERARIVGSALVYAPLGRGGPAYLLPLAAEIPNA